MKNRMHRIATRKNNRTYEYRVNKAEQQIIAGIKDAAKAGKFEFVSRTWENEDMPQQISDAVSNVCKKHKFRYSMTLGTDEDKFKIMW